MLSYKMVGFSSGLFEQTCVCPSVARVSPFSPFSLMSYKNTETGNLTIRSSSSTSTTVSFNMNQCPESMSSFWDFLPHCCYLQVFQSAPMKALSTRLMHLVLEGIQYRTTAFLTKYFSKNKMCWKEQNCHLTKCKFIFSSWCDVET